MTAKDDSERARAGTLPDDPEADAVLMGEGEDGAGTLPDDPEADAGPVMGAAGKPVLPAEPHAIVKAWRPLAELGDVFGQPPPPRRWLFERDGNGVLPLGKPGIFAAAGGVGKTMAMVQAALAVATGKRWFDVFTVPRDSAGRVLLALAEEDEEEVWRRMYHAAGAMNLNENERRAARERIVVLPLAGTHVALTQSEDGGKTIDSPAAEELRAKMTAAGEWRLVVFDPLARFAGVDVETDNARATRFIETVESFCKLPGGPTVLVVHHSAQHARGGGGSGNANRDASHVARGVSGITDGSRWVASLDAEYLSLDAEYLGTDRGAVPECVIEFGIMKHNYGKRPGRALQLCRDDRHGGALRPLDPAEEEQLKRYRRDKDAKKPTPTVGTKARNDERF